MLNDVESSFVSDFRYIIVVSPLITVVKIPALIFKGNLGFSPELKLRKVAYIYTEQFLCVQWLDNKERENLQLFSLLDLRYGSSKL